MGQKLITSPHKLFKNSIIYLGCLPLFCLMLASPTIASNKDKNDIPWYQVEIIIFANNEQVGLGSETWPDDTGIKARDIIELRHPDDEGLAQTSSRKKSELPNFSASEPNMPTPYELLTPGELQLIPVYKKLERSKKYQPLIHIGWRQPTLKPKKATPVYLFNGVELPMSAIAAGANPAGNQPRAVIKENAAGGSRFSSVSVGNYTFDASQYGQLLPITETDTLIGAQFYYLSGTLKLGVSRYLHMEVDLNYRVPVIKEEEVFVDQDGLAMDSFNSSPVSFNQGAGSEQPQMTKLIRREALQNFHMTETRRMRSKEIHFLDNPMFGIVTRVIPYEIPKVEPNFDPASQAFTSGSGGQQQKQPPKQQPKQQPKQ